ncbi:MAG: hypothetical protein ACQEP1_01925 [Nanobdellota archaeon]
MRLTKKLVREVVNELAGEDCYKAANLIYKEPVAEEDIAEIMDSEVKQVRNLLYRLNQYNLAKFKRMKNEKNGWYTYFWSFNKKRVKELSRRMKEAKIERLKYRLRVENETQFFTCKDKCMRLDFEKTLEFDCTCPECGKYLFQENNKKKVRELKKQIRELKKEIE